MQIISPSAFSVMPWKNGGGMTREIIKVEDGSAILWRLSIADVASDGPFSAFPGLARILTVIAGDGLRLQTPADVLLAQPLQPVSFSGDWPITCTRLSETVRDFNVIFDPAIVSSQVTVCAAGESLALIANHEHFHAVLVLGAAVADNRAVETGSVVLLQSGKVHITCEQPMLHVAFTVL